MEAKWHVIGVLGGLWTSIIFLFSFALCYQRLLLEIFYLEF